ncbi:predicted protein [Chaetoceros tenuissimus]|uniref:Uncharacterized protein n=1 Tax=Chaetoceros tenuissimus TaxID=426638 RepID=A0AAD3CJG0_9STRA|nr:predicted protein [Chaetoceros tenuissimus]
MRVVNFDGTGVVGVTDGETIDLGSDQYKLEIVNGIGNYNTRKRNLQEMFGTLFKLYSTDTDLIISVSSGRSGKGRGRTLNADGSTEYNMSFNINGTSYYLGDSVGLCGDYDNAANNGIFARDGTPMTLPNLYPNYAYSLNATALGDDWQVSSPTDPSILSDNTGGLELKGRWSETMCVRYVDQSASVRRSLQLAADGTCKECEDIENNMLAYLNCYYDATVMGCDTSDFKALHALVYSEQAPIQFRLVQGALESPTCTYAASFLNPKTPKAGKGGKAGKAGKGGKSDDDRRLSPKSSKSIKKCEEMGGECVVQCNTATHDCITGKGLCDVDVYGRDEYVPVLTSTFFNGCSCKLDKAPIDD